MFHDSRWRGAAVFMLLGVLLLCLQYWTQLRLERLEDVLERLAPDARGERTAPVTREACAPALSRSDLQLVLRQELGRLGQRAVDLERDDGTAPMRAAEDSVAEEDAPSTPSRENVEAFQRGQEFVANALAARVWGASEVDGFRALRRVLQPDQWLALQKQVIEAINHDRVRVSVDGPPF